MSDEFDIHFKGMRLPVARHTWEKPLRLFWCQSCGTVHDDFDVGNFVKYVQCFCNNTKCREIVVEEDIQKILDYMRQNKKYILTKEDLVEILI